MNHRPVVAIAMQQHRARISSTTTVRHHQPHFGSFAWYETMVVSSQQLLLSSPAEEQQADDDDDCSNRIITATCYIDTDDVDTDDDSSSVLDGGSVVSSLAIDDWVPDDWGEVDSVHPDIHIQNVPAIKTVRFDCVQVREFPLTIGSATQTLDEHQCPLELSWTHLPVEHVVVLPPLDDDSTENNNSCMAHHPDARRRSLYTMATHRPRRLSLRQRQLRIMESQRQYYESSLRGMNQELC
jgi:hypothetical protein